MKRFACVLAALALLVCVPVAQATGYGFRSFSFGSYGYAPTYSLAVPFVPTVAVAAPVYAAPVLAAPACAATVVGAATYAAPAVDPAPVVAAPAPVAVQQTYSAPLLTGVSGYSGAAYGIGGFGYVGASRVFVRHRNFGFNRGVFVGTGGFNRGVAVNVGRGFGRGRSVAVAAPGVAVQVRQRGLFGRRTSVNVFGGGFGGAAVNVNRGFGGRVRVR